MAQNSKIEWTHHTANLWHGCTKVHAGCDNCYAETLAHRWGKDIWGNDKPRLAIKSVWNDFKRYQERAKAAGEIHRVFVGSMMDIFEKPMPVITNKIGETVNYTTAVLRETYMTSVVPTTPNLMHLMLTKRPSNIVKYIPEEWLAQRQANVMFGTSPVDQPTAETLVRQLLMVPGYKFLSVEPMLGPINLWKIPRYQKLDWVICGGESGHHARPMQAEWAISLKRQCEDAGIPFFMKQGSAANWENYYKDFDTFPEELKVRNFPTTVLENARERALYLANG